MKLEVCCSNCRESDNRWKVMRESESTLGKRIFEGLYANDFICDECKTRVTVSVRWDPQGYNNLENLIQ